MLYQSFLSQAPYTLLMKNNQNFIFCVKIGTCIYKNIPNTLISMQKQPNIHCKWLLVKWSLLRTWKAINILPLLKCILTSNSELKVHPHCRTSVTASKSECFIFKFESLISNRFCLCMFKSIFNFWNFTMQCDCCLPGGFLFTCPIPYDTVFSFRVLSLVMWPIQS